MTNLTDHVVSLDLASKLKALGLKQDSIFCWAVACNEHEHRLFYNYERYQDHYIEQGNSYSAFLASELGNAIFEVVRAARDNDLDILEDERIRAVNESNYFELKNEVEVRGEFIVFIIENNLCSKEWRAKWMEVSDD